MTDAALPVTQSAIEQFAEDYFLSLGCSIEKNGDRWDVTVPAEIESDVVGEELTLVCGPHEESPEEQAKYLSPDSEFAQNLLAEASRRTPTGKIQLRSESTSIEPPVWVREGDVDVEEMEFSPYYNRNAAVILFRVAIETVSEYQREFLRTVALDTLTQEPLSGLEETFLDVTTLDGSFVGSTSAALGHDAAEELLTVARSRVIERLQDLIDEIHREASRAADAELEEFRRMKEQRLEELDDQRAELSRRIEELATKIDGDVDSERVEALKERQDLKAEFEAVASEVAELRDRRDQGFPERQREIRDRHALEVRVSPLTLTMVEYESGEMQLEVGEKGDTHMVTVGYGAGVGATETLRCAACGREFTAENPVSSINDGLHCEACHSLRS